MVLNERKLRMSRHAPTVLFEHQEGNKIVEVCEADAVFAIFYNGRPIKMRQREIGVKYYGFKYMKSFYPESGHAIRLCARLNQRHNTDEFTVVQLNSGRTLK